MKNLGIWLLGFAIVFNLVLSSIPLWRGDLETDLFNYFRPTVYFSNNGNLQNFGTYEYQPGAVFYFLLVSMFSFVYLEFSSFYASFLISSALLAILLGYIINKYCQEKGLILYSLLLISTGPIFLLRFEILTVIFMVLALVWLKDKPYWSALSLAVSIAIKIFPAFLLPYLFLLVWQKNKKLAVNYGLSVMVVLLAILVFYVTYMRVDLSTLMAGVSFHAKKPMHGDGFYGNLIFLLSSFVGGGISIDNNWGVVGMDYPAFFGPSEMYNYLFLLPLGAIYFWVARQKKMLMDYRIIYLILGVVVVFSKVVSPQYLLWFVYLLPFCKLKNIKLVTALTATALILTQLFYPLNYASWVRYLSLGEMNIWVYVNLVKYLILILSFKIIFDETVINVITKTDE